MLSVCVCVFVCMCVRVCVCMYVCMSAVRKQTVVLTASMSISTIEW